MRDSLPVRAVVGVGHLAQFADRKGRVAVFEGTPTEVGDLCGRRPRDVVLGVLLPEIVFSLAGVVVDNAQCRSLTSFLSLTRARRPRPSPAPLGP